MHDNTIAVIGGILSAASKAIADKTGLKVDLSYSIQRTLDKEARDIEELLEQVCTIWGVDLEKLRIPCKKRENVAMRQILWLVMRANHPYLTLEECGALLGNRHYTTVMCALRDVENHIATNDELFMRFFNPVRHFTLK